MTDAYREGDAPYEVDITGRMLGAVVDRLDGREIKGLQWRAKQFRTARGIGAEERLTGADFMGVLDIDISGYSTRKGFLAQAKRAEPGEPFSDWSRLCSQIDDMLRISSASYVFIYSKRLGIRVFPALSVLGLKSRNIFELYDRSVQRFFEEHFECFVGDRNLSVPNINTLLAAGDFPASRALVLGAAEHSTGDRVHDT
ncbi:MAG: hypothetical protein RLO21_12605 [Nitratireductor sp.]